MDDIAESANECICPHGPFARRALDDTSPRLHDRNGNPTACFDSCRQSFFHLVTGFTTIDVSDTSPFEEFCSKVTGHNFSPQFWQLYWCDVAFCGLWLPPNKTGEDPNVDRIINRCQNFGFSSIYDPGPPPSTFSCNGLPTDGPGAPCPNHTYMLPAGTNSPTPAMALASATTDTTDMTGTADASVSFRTPTSSSQAETAGTSRGSNNTSAGLLAAVVVCVVVGVFVLAALLLFLVRRRRKNNNSLRRDPAWSAYPSDGGPMRSVAGPDGPPPLSVQTQAYYSHSRGRSRLFRAKGAVAGRSASPPLTSLSPPPSPTAVAAAAAAPPIPYYFPSSPICAPTTNKLEPRRETAAAVPTWASRHGSREKNWSQETAVSPVSPQPTALSLPPVAASKLPCSSDSEVSCVSARSSVPSSLYGHALTTNGEVAAAAASATVMPPSSPTRPPRPHEAPLAIPGLVTPDPSAEEPWTGRQGRVVYVQPVVEG